MQNSRMRSTLGDGGLLGKVFSLPVVDPTDPDELATVWLLGEQAFVRVKPATGFVEGSIPPNQQTLAFANPGCQGTPHFPQRVSGAWIVGAAGRVWRASGPPVASFSYTSLQQSAGNCLNQPGSGRPATPVAEAMGVPVSFGPLRIATQ